MFNKGRWIAAFLSVTMITSMVPSAILSAQEVTEEQELTEEVTEGSPVQENDDESASNNAGSETVAPEDKTEETEEESKEDSKEESKEDSEEKSEKDSKEESEENAENPLGNDETIEAKSKDSSEVETSDEEKAALEGSGEEETTEQAAEQKEAQGAQNVEITGTIPAYTAEPSPNAGSSDDLFEQYANRLFYGAKPKLRGAKNTGDRLTGQNRVIYDKIREVAAQVADGDRPDTRCTITFEELGLNADGVFSAKDLGLEYIYDFTTGTWNSGLNDAISSLFSFDLQLVQNSLYADCPYELYWGSVLSIEGDLEYSTDGSKLWFSNNERTIGVIVQPYYRDSSDPTGYMADTDITGVAASAASYATTIIKGADAYDTDYDKLSYFKDEICDLVDYNYEAAGNSANYPNKNPWALIYVFDQDPETKVVCEGYSEAFQYLCSQADFIDDSVCAYSVTGKMHKLGESGEGHKWNIVHMDDGRNYIADITNSDIGSWGQDGELFLTGAVGSVDEGYMFPDNDNTEYMCYEYDEETLTLFSKAELTLSRASYFDNDPIDIDEVAKLSDISLVLTDMIGMRIHVIIDSYFVDDNDYIQFEHNGETVKQLVKDAVSTKELDDDFYEVVFELPLSTTQMTDLITFKMVVDDKPGEPKQYSVKSYVEQMLEEPDLYTSGEITLARNLLHYGAFVQKYVDYNVDNLPNQIAELGEFDWNDDPDLIKLKDYQHSVDANDKDHGFLLDYATLILGSEVSLRFYYHTDENHDVSDFNVYITDGAGHEFDYTTGYSTDKNLYYIMIPNIKPIDLGYMYKLVVDAGNERLVNLNYSPLSYCYSKLSREGRPEKSKDLCKALYKYYMSVYECIYGPEYVD